MEDGPNRAIGIAVGLFVTLALTSSIIFIINQVKTVYNDEEKIDISIHSSLSQYLMYDNTILTGIDMVNAAKKYKDSKNVTIVFVNGNRETKINTTNWVNSNKNYSTRNTTSRLYRSSYDYTGYDSIRIEFIFKS